MKIFAEIISRIFDFYFWSPVLLVVALFNTNLSKTQIKILLPVLVVLDFLLPLAVFVLFIKEGKISDIDITKRKERYLIFGLGTLTFLLSTIAVFFLADHLIFVLSLIVLAISLTLFLITFRWKISGHMIMNCGAIFTINYLFGWHLMWLFLIVPLVAFARIYLHKHTLGQVLAGGFLGIVEPYLILRLFNLI